MIPPESKYTHRHPIEIGKYKVGVIQHEHGEFWYSLSDIAALLKVSGTTYLARRIGKDEYTMVTKAMRGRIKIADHIRRYVSLPGLRILTEENPKTNMKLLLRIANKKKEQMEITKRELSMPKQEHRQEPKKRVVPFPGSYDVEFRTPTVEQPIEPSEPDSLGKALMDAYNAQLKKIAAMEQDINVLKNRLAELWAYLAQKENNQ